VDWDIAGIFGPVLSRIRIGFRAGFKQISDPHKLGQLDYNIPRCPKSEKNSATIRNNLEHRQATWI